jgi:thioredoxin:protein disulfide reductase
VLSGWRSRLFILLSSSAGRLSILLSCLPALWPGWVAAQDTYLSPGEAFRVAAQVSPDARLALQITVAPGYHLYRDRLVLQSDAGGAPTLDLPPAERLFDSGLGQEVAVYRHPFQAASHESLRAGARLSLRYQGCADQGLCYPPMTLSWQVQADGRSLKPLADPSAPMTTQPDPAPVTPAATAPADSESRFVGLLRGGRAWQVMPAFWLAGLLLSLTPCVLPMIPILSSIIVGQRATASRRHGLAMALAYSLGMALVYTAFGVAAGWLGEGLAGALQNAWVLGAFGALLAILALSMFGAYQLQLPSRWQSALSERSASLQGGRWVGVFLMGGLSALIVGPCVAAPLAGALVYISQTHDALLGGLALFAMAGGMSVPLLLVGASAGALMPAAGAWMEKVKQGFGFVLLGTALWMVAPVVPTDLLMLSCAALLFMLSAWLGHAEQGPRPAATPGAHWSMLLGKGMGMGVAVLAALELAGWATGGTDLLHPLAQIQQARAGADHPGTLAFTPIQSLAQLDQEVTSSTRPVMLDLYADWCVSCKEFERETLADAQVRQRLGGWRLLRLDLTHDDASGRELLRHFQLFGPPAALLFPARTPGEPRTKVIGFEPPARFLRALDALSQRR